MDMGLRSRCRRKMLTTYKSGFQPLFSPPVPFSLPAEREVAARRPVRSPVRSPSRWRPCRLIPGTSPCRLPACRVAYLPVPGPRALCSRMSMRFSARAGVRLRRCPVPCPERRPWGLCHHACPPRHLRLFYGLCTYIGLGVYRKVYFRRVLRILRRQVIPV
jgi:hypothetical protein